MASRATIRCSTRQSEFCGEDTTAGVDMRKLRFRGRAYCPGGGVPSRTVSPHPVPHQRDGIGHESRRRTGTTEGDKPRWTRLAAMERESAGRGGAHLKTGGAHRAPSFSTPADGAAVAADDASRSAVLREDAPRPERAQALNRFLARRELLDKLEARARGVAEAAAAERARIRRQKRRRSRRAKEKLLAAKRALGQKKAARRAPSMEE